MFSANDSVNLGIPPPGGQRQQPSTAPDETFHKTDVASGHEAATAGVKRKATRVAERQPADQPTSGSARRQPEKDQVELNLALSREERDAFSAAFGKDGADASEEEKTVAQKAAERITKHIDDTLSRSTANRELVEKALAKWYSKMTKGEHRGPTELLELLYRAANGEFDESGKPVE